MTHMTKYFSKTILVIAALCITVTAFALETRLNSDTGKKDYYGIDKVTALPSTCSTGKLVSLSTATTDNQLYLCRTANTWVWQGTGSTGAKGDTGATGPAGSVSDATYSFDTWTGQTGTAPSQNAMANKLSAMDTTISGKAAVATVSELSGRTTGTNTGDETAATIKSKLGISTLSGSNTGDETQSTIFTKIGYTPVPPTRKILNHDLNSDVTFTCGEISGCGSGGSMTYPGGSGLAVVSSGDLWGTTLPLTTYVSTTNNSGSGFYGRKAGVEGFFSSWDYYPGTTNHAGMPLYSAVSLTAGDYAFDVTNERLLISDGSATKTFTPTGTLTNGKYCIYDSASKSVICDTTPGGGGTVTSVALSMPAEFNIVGSPLTSGGTLTVTRASQTQNFFLAAPNGSSGTPTFRGIVAADIPALSYAPLRSASTTTDGAVQLTDSVTSSSISTAATPSAVKAAYDLANAAISKGTPSTGSGNMVYSQSPTLKGQLETVYNLSSACSSTVTPDITNGTIFTVTINSGTACGIANPAAITAGMSFSVKITHSSTGVLNLGSAYKFPGGTVPTWSTTATKYDVLSCASFEGTALQCNGLVDVR